MQVKLKVMVGKSKGKEIVIPVSRFLIGRGKDCHMRPKSDAISRNHCTILTREDGVVIRDLNSRNGTYVNGERIEGDCELNEGDRLKVGRLDFEVVIERTAEQSEPEPPQEVAQSDAGAAKSDSGSIDFDVNEWLAEADEREQARRQAEPETRQFQLDETDRVQLENAEGEDAEEGDKDKKWVRPEKKKPGKLPDRPQTESATSRDAAADMLKKFFDNR